MINVNDSFNNRIVFRYSPNEQLVFTPGVWVNGKCYWLQNSTEKIIYEEQIIFKVRSENIHSKIRLFHLYVSNRSSDTKELKLLAMHHHSSFSHDHITFVSPTDRVLFHHTRNEIFMVNGHYNGKGIEDYTIQPFWNAFTDRIWSCQDKGIMKYQPMGKSPSVSIFTLNASVKGNETIKLNTWMITGQSKNELMALNQVLLKNTLAFPFEK